MIKDVLQDTRKHMEKTVESLQLDLRGIRTGRASPALLDSVRVDYFGMPTPLNQLATVSAPEAHLLLIRPFNRTDIGAIEKGILKSGLGLNPSNDGQVIRLVVPQLTEERRRELSKQVSRRTEEARVSTRNLRRDAIDFMRDLEKEKEISEDDLEIGEKKVQELTDEFVEHVNQIGKTKEAEILEG
jgi:ribosome recycling factor